MRSRYIDPLSEGEIANLIRVAAFAQFEMALPAIALPNPLLGFPISQAMNGLVLQDEHGMDRRRVFRLSHPAIGSLILRAAVGVDKQKERLAGAIGDPATGLQLLHWLSAGNEREEVLKQLETSLNSLAWLGNLSRFAASRWHRKGRLPQRSHGCFVPRSVGSVLKPVRSLHY